MSDRAIYSLIIVLFVAIVAGALALQIHDQGESPDWTPYVMMHDGAFERNNATVWIGSVSRTVGISEFTIFIKAINGTVPGEPEYWSPVDNGNGSLVRQTGSSGTMQEVLTVVYHDANGDRILNHDDFFVITFADGVPTGARYQVGMIFDANGNVVEFVTIKVGVLALGLS